jgi:hypothetical protein
MERDTKIEGLISNLKAYRSAMDRLFSLPLARPSDCRKYFLNLLICVTRLYLDVLVLSNELSKGSVPRRTTALRRPEPISVDADRFMKLREHFRERLDSLQCWEYFQPEIPFSELTGLRTRSDYLNSFTLHLPEIYEETVRAEKYAQAVLGTRGTIRTSELMVSLQHLGHNHISFVLPSLQWAADEMTWRD